MGRQQFDWKRATAAKIRSLTPEEARAKLAAIRAEGITANHETIRDLTGGYSSQSINPVVIRALAIRAGVIKDFR